MTCLDPPVETAGEAVRWLFELAFDLVGSGVVSTTLTEVAGEGWAEFDLEAVAARATALSIELRELALLSSSSWI